MDNQDLLSGIAAAKSGNYEKAVQYLARAVQSDPMSVDGWLFLGHSLSDIEKRRYCYQRVLSLDPQNEIARASLTRLDEPQKVEPPVPEIAAPLSAHADPAPVVDAPAQSIQPKQGGMLSALAFGFILALLLFALPGILLLGGKFDDYLINTYLVPDMMARVQAAPLGPPLDQMSADVYINDAAQALDKRDYKKAITYLDQVIAAFPNYPKDGIAYALRAKAYYHSNDQEHVLSTYNANLQKTLADIDMAISFQPTAAEFYALRRDTLSDISIALPNQVDHEYILKAVIDNDRKFISLSPSVDRRLHLAALLSGDLILAGQCQAGMQIVTDLKKKILPTGDLGSYGSYMFAEAAGYACLGDMDKAAQSMDNIISKSKSCLACRVYLKALFLYQAGKRQQALDALNTSISASPTFSGDRYYLRAMIDLDMGDKQQAIQDLQIGSGYTWGHAELYAYANGRLALANGDRQSAIQWFQIAEASFYPYFSVLHKQVINDLAKLGAEPQPAALSVNFQTTPMPPVTPIP